MAYTHILAPTDLSEAANHALRHAFEEAEIHRAPLILLHVLPPHDAVIGVPTGYDPDTGGALPVPRAPAPEIGRFDQAEEARTQLKQLVPETFKGEWSTLVAVGKPADVILQTAQEQDVDLIVMGTHGHTGFCNTLLGSVAEAVVHRTPCPVLVIRYGT